MAEQKEQQPQAAKKDKTTMKALVLVGVVLLLEGLTIGLTMYFGGSDSAEAQGLQAQANIEANKPVEIMLIADKFDNRMTGRVLTYDTEIFVEVKSRNESHVNEYIENNTAQLRDVIAAIFRGAEHVHLKEDELGTLKRQIGAVLEDHFGVDDQNEPIIQKIYIPRCRELRID